MVRVKHRREVHPVLNCVYARTENKTLKPKKVSMMGIVTKPEFESLGSEMWRDPTKEFPNK